MFDSYALTWVTDKPEKADSCNTGCDQVCRIADKMFTLFMTL